MDQQGGIMIKVSTEVSFSKTTEHALQPLCVVVKERRDSNRECHI